MTSSVACEDFVGQGEILRLIDLVATFQRVVDHDHYHLLFVQNRALTAIAKTGTL